MIPGFKTSRIFHVTMLAVILEMLFIKLALFFHHLSNVSNVTYRLHFFLAFLQIHGLKPLNLPDFFWVSLL